MVRGYRFDPQVDARSFEIWIAEDSFAGGPQMAHFQDEKRVILSPRVSSFWWVPTSFFAVVGIAPF